MEFTVGRKRLVAQNAKSCNPLIRGQEGICADTEPAASFVYLVNCHYH